jgi:hypothetical protein
VSKKTAILADATIAVAARPRVKPSERREVLAWRLNFEALAARGVCCFGISGGVGEVFAPSSSGVIINA